MRLGLGISLHKGGSNIRSLDPDIGSFSAITGATDTEGLSSLVTYAKSENLWDNFVIYPLKSSQNYGSGSIVRGLGGLTTNNIQLYGNPTWGSTGITFTNLQYGLIDDFLEGGNNITAAVRRSGGTTAGTYFLGQYDIGNNQRSWAMSTVDSPNIIRLARSTDGSLANTEFYRSISSVVDSGDYQYIASWNNSLVSLWRNKTNFAISLFQNSVVSTRYDSPSPITLNGILNSGNPTQTSSGLYTSFWICTLPLSTTQRETITDLVNAL